MVMGMKQRNSGSNNNIVLSKSKDNKYNITLSKELGQKEFAYEIKKCKSGFYFLYNIDSSDDKAVKEFNRVASIDENVLRHLVLNIEK